MRVLYIGRFQPFHWGHFEALKYIFEISDLSQVILGIGSAQESYTFKNPFTAGERFEMLLETLQKENIAPPNRYLIVPIPDLNNNNQWIAYIQSMLPRFNMIFSNNSLVENLVKSFSSLEYRSIPLQQRDKWSSTEIRKRILNNDTWDSLVPPSIKKLIMEFNGVSRLQSLNISDKN